MPAPYPYDGVAGALTDPAEAEALNLYMQYCWLARWSDEMTKDEDLDCKKLSQFVFHCRQFRRWYDELNAMGPSAKDVIEGMFALKKARWASRAAMLQDLQSIYDACGAFHDWFEANMPEAKKYATIKFDANWNQTDEPIVVAKTRAVAERVAAFRALFD